MNGHGYGFTTQQLHAGVETTPGGVNPRATPIHLSAGFVFDDFDEARDRFGDPAEGFSYTRVGNPTTAAAERRIAALEGGRGALLVGSGQAAVAVTVLALAGAGDHLVSAESIYEGSRGLFLDNLSRLGIETSFVDRPNDAAAWERAIRPTTRALFIESIPNPRNDLIDIALVAQVARRHGIPLIVDNTFATPYLLRPLEHGADIVVHSASKFLAGHGSVLGGVVVSDDEEFLVTARDASMRFGPSASPLNSFLIQQGVETLSLRVERQSANALAVARYLEAQPEVLSVDYSGLESSPSHALAGHYLPRGQGSVFSFTLDGGEAAARAFFDAVGLFTRMTHLGDVRSLVIHPATTSHAQRTPEQRAAAGVGPGMLRVSVGIEDLDDLLDDLAQALAAVRAALAAEGIAAPIEADAASAVAPGASAGAARPAPAGPAQPAPAVVAA